jgi:hypothetical protein
MSDDRRDLFLAAGLQSGGTTLVSWCFLQRGDMDGVLDLYPDVLTPISETHARFAWAKGTIASFTFDEIADYYRWQGWDVHPLLIVRDVRDAYSSLQRKWYGPNGTTAEDPPLRTRFLRFHASWQTFVENGWPVLCYERLVKDPEHELRSICGQLGLDWDPAMLAWPKPAEHICTFAIGNQTLLESLGDGGIAGALIQQPKRCQWDDIGASDMRWLQEQFGDMIAAFDYPSFPAPGTAVTVDHLPSFEVTRRHATERQIDALYQQLENRKAAILRLRNHPVLGRLIRIWAKWVNPSLRQVFDDAES